MTQTVVLDKVGRLLKSSAVPQKKKNNLTKVLINLWYLLIRSDPKGTINVGLTPMVVCVSIMHIRMWGNIHFQTLLLIKIKFQFVTEAVPIYSYIQHIN
jgi:hypothetical protein